MSDPDAADGPAPDDRAQDARAPHARDESGLRVGERLELTVGDPAHGGACVARHEGRVVFVRHAAPGERVVARVTSVRSRLAFADAVEVLERAPDRVEPPCALARPGGCGGCDLQHLALPAQRSWKASVVAEQLRRLAHLDVDVVVEPVPGDADGLDWRTRVHWATRADGRLGLRRFRSHAVIAVEDCPIAHPGLPPVTRQRWPGTTGVRAIRSSGGQRLAVAEPSGAPQRTRIPTDVDADGVVVDGGGRRRGRGHVTESAAGRHWRVSGSGFWQVHPGAAELFAGTVLEMLAPATGESVWDLYSGVGLFAGTLAELVGDTGSVVAVEGSRPAVADARRNLHDLVRVRVVHAPVERALAGAVGGPRADRIAGPVDLVVLDPPRTGAGAAVVRAIAAAGPRAVAYVACDPAALARDLATFAAADYRLEQLRAFDAFPMTHHVECLAHLVPAGTDS